MCSWAKDPDLTGGKSELAAGSAVKMNLGRLRRSNRIGSLYQDQEATAEPRDRKWKLDASGWTDQEKTELVAGCD